MSEKKQVFHGSDLEKIEEIYGIKKEDIIPFGGNVNPLGISPLFRESLIRHVDAVCTYPDRDYKSLRSTLSLYARIPMEHIIVGNGVTELISLTMHLLRPKKALLLSPTYSEYMREISMIGGTCLEYNLKESSDFCLDVEDLKHSLTDDVDLFAFCNPNNPTSSALNKDQISEILSHCKKHGIFVLADETYAEFAPDIDAVTAVPLTRKFDNLFVLGELQSLCCTGHPPRLRDQRKYEFYQGSGRQKKSMEHQYSCSACRRSNVHGYRLY
ncbi:threonine-phosphate decarboxylase [Anaerostipes caccae]|nr:aminotransferase class I/II-fold pyridoxal phosphate-dependent enzyme [Anaerostipes caccae]EFV21511.1 threonine-phosphate decarboxylase [Anaerostipes caccae]